MLFNKKVQRKLSCEGGVDNSGSCALGSNWILRQNGELKPYFACLAKTTSGQTLSNLTAVESGRKEFVLYEALHNWSRQDRVLVLGQAFGEWKK